MPSGKAICLCGAIDIAIPAETPNKTELCHCNTCRHSTGNLFSGWVGPLDTAPSTEALEKCTVYRSSKTHDRYFCSTCGCKTFVHGHHRSDGSVRGDWFIFGGCIDPPADVGRILDVTCHAYVSDAVDGGMAPFMIKLDGRDIPCFDQDEQSSELSPTAMQQLPQKPELALPKSSESDLTAECHCGSVSVQIQQANHENRSISELERFIAKDKDDKPTGKHMAFCCVCRYCRLHSGSSLTPWTYIPRSQVINPHSGKAVVLHREAETGAGKAANKGLESLTYYWSSEDGCRSFCSVCGASVFYTYEHRQEIVNVAAGILRAEEGALARRWLSWQWGRTPWWKEGTTQRDVMEAWQATATDSKLT